VAAATPDDVQKLLEKARVMAESGIEPKVVHDLLLPMMNGLIIRHAEAHWKEAS
jgi:hypothetical protein